MNRSLVAVTMAAILAAPSAPAAESAIKTTWSGFQQQATRQKLSSRAARISLDTGGEFKATFLRAEDDGLVVRANKQTRRWATSRGEAKIPRDSVSGIRFTGKVGRGGLIGGLAGLGAGAGIVAALASSWSSGDCEGNSCGGVLLLIPVLAVVGYFAGHAVDKRAPAFLIER